MKKLLTSIISLLLLLVMAFGMTSCGGGGTGGLGGGDEELPTDSEGNTIETYYVPNITSFICKSHLIL